MSVHQATTQYVTAAFQHLVDHLLAVSFSVYKTLEAFPWTFWSWMATLCWGPNEWQRVLITSSGHLGSLHLISPNAFGALMCPDCTKQTRLQSEDSSASAKPGPRPPESGGCKHQRGGVVCHCPDHFSSPSLLSICNIFFHSSISCAALCLFSQG